MNLNEKLNWLNLVCKHYSLGQQIYDMFVETTSKSPGTEIIVSPANLGDTVFIASLAKSYKRHFGLNRLIIVAKKRQADAAEWFEGVDAVLGLEDKEIECLRYFFTVSRKFYNDGVRYGHIPCYIDEAYPNTFFHIPPGFDGDSLRHIWESRILGIPEESEMGKIVVPKGMLDPAKKELYKDAVLIAPAAFTNKGIPESFWEKLVGRLTEAGIKVYCNSGGLYYDKIINGAEELVLSTKELMLLAPVFRHVVAVRSGFTDLVSKTDAKLSVLHLGESDGRSLRIEYGSRPDDVRDLGRIEGIYPVLYCGEREDEVIGNILEDIMGE